GWPVGGVDDDAGPRGGGARGMRGRPGAVAGEQSPCAAIAPGRPLSAARVAPMPTLWRSLLREPPEPERPQRQTARLCLLPLSGDGCLSLWGRAHLPQYAGADRPVGRGGVAGSLYLADPSGAARGRIPAS